MAQHVCVAVCLLSVRVDGSASASDDSDAVLTFSLCSLCSLLLPPLLPPREAALMVDAIDDVTSSFDSGARSTPTPPSDSFAESECNAPDADVVPAGIVPLQPRPFCCLRLCAVFLEGGIVNSIDC